MATNGADAAAAEVPAPPNVLAEGRMYQRVTIADGVASAAPVFMWHDPSEGKLGTLYYSHTEGDQTKRAEQSMPVSKIKDVFLGKQTAEFKTEFGATLASNTCFSLMLDASEGLHLVAPDDQTRNATLATIKGFWAAPKAKKSKKDKKKNKDNKADEEEAAAVAAAAAAAAAAVVAAEEKAAVDAAAEKEVADKAAADAAAASAAADEEKAAADAAAASAAAEKEAADKAAAEAAADEESKIAAAAAATAAAAAVVAAVTIDAEEKQANGSSAAPETPPAADATPSDPSANIAAMRAGASFKSYEIVAGAESAQPEPETIFVWLSTEAEDGPIGTLYYAPGDSEAAKEAKSTDRCLRLDQTKDVFVGRHSWKKVQAPSPSAPTSRFLSLVAGERALHLEAADDATRAQWAQGVRNVFEDAHRRAAEAKAAEVPVVVAATPLQPGGEYTSHTVNADGVLTSTPVFVFYVPEDAKLGTVYWCEVGKREKVPVQQVALHKVSDVFLGKHPAYAKTEGAANIRTAHCFSLVSRAASVHLEARDAEHRTATITELRGVFEKANKKVDERKALVLPEVPMSPRAGNGASPAVEDATISTSLEEGTDFDAWNLDARAEHCAPSPVHVWLEPVDGALGVLYWAAGSGNRVKVEEQSLPLGEITDVFVGRHTDEFQHADAKDLPHDRCISLRSQTHPDHNLNLAAPSSQAQRRWLRGLRNAFAANPATTVETRPVPSGVIPPEAVSSPRSERTLRVKLAALVEGHAITQVKEDGSQQSVTLWLDREEGRAGTLYWTTEADKREKDPERSIAVHTISDVYVGRKTTVLREAKGVPADGAFSVASSSRRLHAFAPTEPERARILAGLQAAVGATGTPVREYVHPNVIEANKSLVADLAHVRRGQVALLHVKGQAAPRNIFLWYEASAGKQGALFWSFTEKGKKPTKTKQPKQTILLQHVADVMSGRQSDILKASTFASLRNDNCFALLTSHGPRLDVQVASRGERDEWLRALRSVFSAASKRVIEGSGTAAVRKLLAGTIVDTWFGRGVVVAETRKDGLTAVDIGGTMCFFNGPTLQATPLLYTPYGAGVKPLRTEPREDGIQVVQLAYATAYMNSQSVSTVEPVKKISTADQCTAYLLAGQPFTHVSAAGQKPVFVYLNLASATSATPLGSLDYNAGNRRTVSPLGSIPLSAMSDLFLGKQTPALKTLPATVPNARVFSVVSKNGTTLDLVADTPPRRSDFVFALFNRLSTKGRKISQQPSNGSSSPRAAAQKLAPIQVVLPAPEQAVVDLTKGAPFKLIILSADGTRHEEEAFVFLRPGDEPAFVWSSTFWTSHSPARDSPLRTVSLAGIRDVYYGRKTPVFLEPVFAQTPVDRCFSFSARDKTQWNLIGQSRLDRDKFFFAMQSLLSGPTPAYVAAASASPVAVAASSSPAPVEAVAAEVAVEAAAEPVAAEPVEAAASAEPAAAAAADNVVTRGAMFTRWTSVGEGSGADVSVADDVTGSSVFVFHETDGSKYGALYWNATEGDRERHLERMLPLHATRDVFMGKNTPVTRCAKLSAIPKDQFVSLVASAPKGSSLPPTTLDLQAGSAAERSEWVTVLKTFWKATKSEKGGKNKAASVAPVAAAVVPSAVEPAEEVKETEVAASETEAPPTEFVSVAPAEEEEVAAVETALEAAQPIVLVHAPETA